MRQSSSSLVSSLLFLAASALPAPQFTIPIVDPNLVYPRNHTLETCPLETWGFPTFDIDKAVAQRIELVEVPPSQYWNVSLLEGEPISGGASNNLSYFQGTLAPNVLRCQIYGYTTFSDSGHLDWVLTTAITLEPGIQYAFSYTLNYEVERLYMQTSYGYTYPLGINGEVGGRESEVVGFVWSQYIGSKGHLGGIEFMLKEQLNVTFYIETDKAIDNPLAGSLAVFKLGP